MTRPIIGIPNRVISDPSFGIPAQGNSSSYIDSIIAAGGTPLMLPLLSQNTDSIAQYVDMCSGFVFSGGEDVDPSRYKAKPHPKLGKLSLERDNLEFLLFAEVQKRKKPTLGVCRGAQFINVALGGTLYQDIPTECPKAVQHSTKDEDWYALLHDVEFSPGSKMANAVGAISKPVNSIHHQCVRDLAPSLLAVAKSTKDGIIEGVESKPGTPWIMAVQWHPEVLWKPKGNGGAGEEWNLKFFEALIAEAS